MPVAVTVGRVTAVAWPGQAGLAATLAEAADRTGPFPGIGRIADRPLRLILAPTRASFDSLTRGRLPGWSDGAAFPATGSQYAGQCQKQFASTPAQFLTLLELR